MELEGKIIRGAELYVVEKGKARHITTWEVYVAFCMEKFGKVLTASAIISLSKDEFPEEGRRITEWPEKEFEVGPERLFYCVPPDCDFQRLADLEVTVIHEYSIYWHGYPNHHDFGHSYLDNAQKYGLKVMYDLKAMLEDNMRAGHPWDKDNLARIIGMFDAHPALWAWKLYDEPDGGMDDPKILIPMQTQQEIHDFIRARSQKPLTCALLGGTRGWHLVNLDLFDFIMPGCYVYDGTGEMWEMEPLQALELVTKQERKYLDENYPNKPTMFTMQTCDSPATGADPPNYGTKVPLSHIEEMFSILREYNLLKVGISGYGWSGGDFDPMRNDELYTEIKNLFDKLEIIIGDKINGKKSQNGLVA